MALIAYEVPLSPVAQTFLIALAGTTYRLTVSWNDAPTGGWVLDIADSNSNPIVSGIPLVTGADLLAQYAYLNLGGSMVVQSDFDMTSPPDFDNLGTTSHLYFIADDGT